MNYLSISEGKFRIILSNGMPLCADKSTIQEALNCAKQSKVELQAEAWNGNIAQWVIPKEVTA